MNNSANIAIRACSSILFALVVTTVGGCSEYASTDTRAMKERLVKYDLQKSTTDRNLVRFDVIDSDAISKREWELFNNLHAQDVVVNWPDGHSTKGIAVHAEDARALLTFAPDAWVEAHPVSFGSGEWTCVTATVVGTFLNPMPTKGGKTIPPTGKRFRIPMCTVAHWKDGRIVEKSWYWDNHALMEQLGISQ